MQSELSDHTFKLREQEIIVAYTNVYYSKNKPFLMRYDGVYLSRKPGKMITPKLAAHLIDAAPKPGQRWVAALFASQRKPKRKVIWRLYSI